MHTVAETHSSDFGHLAVAALTDVGVRRKNNEDSVLALPEHGVFCVADGMGGAEGGEVASQAAVQHLEEAFAALSSPRAAAAAEGKGRLVDATLNRTSRWVRERSEAHGITGSGTTAVVLALDALDPSRGLVLHAGDSRAYRLRADRIEQLSRDHTVAAAAGITNEADVPPMFRGVVTRAVGVNRRVEIEKTPVDVRPGDVFVLASDGLDKMVTKERIAELIRRSAPADADGLARALVDEANRNGGVDNVSVVVVRVGEPGAPPAPPADGGRELEDALAAIQREMAESDRRYAEAHPPEPVSTVPDARLFVDPESDTDEHLFAKLGVKNPAKLFTVKRGTQVALVAAGVLLGLALLLLIAQHLRNRPRIDYEGLLGMETPYVAPLPPLEASPAAAVPAPEDPPPEAEPPELPAPAGAAAEP